MEALKLIKKELLLNEKALFKALKAGNMTELVQLKNQRDNLKDMAIKELEKQLLINSNKLVA